MIEMLWRLMNEMLVHLPVLVLVVLVVLVVLMVLVVLVLVVLVVLVLVVLVLVVAVAALAAAAAEAVVIVMDVVTICHGDDDDGGLYVMHAANASGSTTADLTFQVQEVQTVDATAIDQKLATNEEFLGEADPFNAEDGDDPGYMSCFQNAKVEEEHLPRYTFDFGWGPFGARRETHVWGGGARNRAPSPLATTEATTTWIIASRAA
eukprot:s439_g2.t1